MITQGQVKGEHKTNLVSQYILVPETNGIREGFELAEFTAAHLIELEDMESRELKN